MIPDVPDEWHPATAGRDEFIEFKPLRLPPERRRSLKSIKFGSTSRMAYGYRNPGGIGTIL
jgi:hypothetical protein